MEIDDEDMELDDENMELDDDEELDNDDMELDYDNMEVDEGGPESKGAGRKYLENMLKDIEGSIMQATPDPAKLPTTWWSKSVEGEWWKKSFQKGARVFAINRDKRNAESTGVLETRPIPPEFIEVSDSNPQLDDCNPVALRVLRYSRGNGKARVPGPRACKIFEFRFFTKGKEGVAVVIDINEGRGFMAINFQDIGTGGDLKSNPWQLPGFRDKFPSLLSGLMARLKILELRRIVFYGIRNAETAAVFYNAGLQARSDPAIGEITPYNTYFMNLDLTRRKRNLNDLGFKLTVEVSMAIIGTDETAAAFEFLYQTLERLYGLRVYQVSAIEYSQAEPKKWKFGKWKPQATDPPRTPDRIGIVLGLNRMALAAWVGYWQKHPHNPRPKPLTGSPMAQAAGIDNDAILKLSAACEVKGRESFSLLETQKPAVLPIIYRNEWEDPEPPSFPRGYVVDYSWSGWQTYPFEALSKSLQLWERAASDLEFYGSQDIVQHKGSYRKVNLNEDIGDEKPAELRLVTSSSAHNQHLAFRWPLNSAVYLTLRLEHLLYLCWQIGSNHHHEFKGSRPSHLNMAHYRKLPLVPLKYITIWGVEEPNTVSILQFVYIEFGKYSREDGHQNAVLPGQEAFSWTYSEIKDDTQMLYYWNTILGSPAILPILKMCQYYRLGLRYCNIASIRFSFHQKLSVSDPGGTSWNSASILVELTTVIEESQLSSKLEQEQDLSQRAIERVKGLNIPGVPDTQEIEDFDFADASNFMHVLEYVVDTPHTTAHPMLQTLDSRLGYKESSMFSDAPSYTHVNTIQWLQGPEPEYKSYKICFRTAVSAQERHLVFRDREMYEHAPPDRKGKGREGSQTNEFFKIDINQSAESQVLVSQLSLGEILFATWFSQEGWSPVSQITFENVPIDNLRVLLDLHEDAAELSEQTPVITWNWSPGDAWRQFEERFYATNEGSAIKYFLTEKAEFLMDPKIKSVHVGLHTEIPTQYAFVSVEFDRYGPGSSSGARQELGFDTLFHRGVATRLKVVSAIWASFKDNKGHSHGIIGYLPRSYQYSDQRDMQHLSKYKITEAESRFEDEITDAISDTNYISTKFVSDFAFWGPSRARSVWSVQRKDGVDKKTSQYRFSISFVRHQNLVLISMPSSLGRDYNSVVEDLTNAMYAAWVSWIQSQIAGAGHKELPMNTPSSLSHNQALGIEIFTILEVCYESHLALEKIYETYEDLVSSGILHVKDNWEAESQSTGTPGILIQNNEGARLRREQRLWFILLGLAEVSAAANILYKFWEQIDRRYWSPVYFSTITIRRAGGKFQLIIQNKGVGFVDQNKGAAATLYPTLLRIILLFGQRMEIETMLGTVVGRKDAPINFDKFDIQSSADTEDPMATTFRQWFHAKYRGNDVSLGFTGAPRKDAARISTLPPFGLPKEIALQLMPSNFPVFTEVIVRHPSINIHHRFSVGVAERLTVVSIAMASGPFAARSDIDYTGFHRKQLTGLGYSLLAALKHMHVTSAKPPSNLGVIFIDPVTEATRVIIKEAIKQTQPKKLPVKGTPSWYLSVNRFHRVSSLVPYQATSRTTMHRFQVFWNILLGTIEVAALQYILVNYPQATGQRQIYSVGVDYDSQSEKTRILVVLEPNLVTIENGKTAVGLDSERDRPMSG
ncbi:hypothetical protein TWF730_006484 [Orbilia blumenaviensis]|uniref:Uncharacterized protein n=1 Tax=Orbilia blumenaviensis TaxID=1796055 RepID=A0AAV9VEX1_9PEZI